jgi:hypothetical protein
VMHQGRILQEFQSAQLSEDELQSFVNGVGREQPPAAEGCQA